MLETSQSYQFFGISAWAERVKEMNHRTATDSQSLTRSAREKGEAEDLRKDEEFEKWRNFHSHPGSLAKLVS